MLGVFVIMYFLIIRPQNKKEKQATAMRNSIEVGDGVTTIGGIVGRVASIKEDTFVLRRGLTALKCASNATFRKWKSCSWIRKAKRKPKVCFFCAARFLLFSSQENASLLKRLAFFALAAVIGAGRETIPHFAFIKQACRAYLWGEEGICAGVFCFGQGKRR